MRNENLTLPSLSPQSPNHPPFVNLAPWVQTLNIKTYLLMDIKANH